MTGILWYKDDTYLNNVEWNQFAIAELVEVNYVDEVYKPAVFSCTVQNLSGGGGLSQSSIAHNGGGSVDGDIIVTRTGHGLSTTDRVYVSSETTGEVLDRIYEVEKISANTFYIRHFAVNSWTGRKQTGSSVTRITGNGTGGTLTYVPTGKYSIESSTAANPDITMGQEIIYWQMPDKFTLGGPYAHDGSVPSDGVDPLIVTNTGHGYDDNKILQILNESTGAVQDGEYQIINKTTDTYKLRHIKSQELLVGNDIAGTLSTYVDNNATAFPLFYGTITSLEATWSPSYGKVIKIQAKDHLQYFNNTTVKKLQKKQRPKGAKIGSTDYNQGTQDHMGASLKSPVYLDGQKTKLVGSTEVSTETKFSHAISHIVDDFNEGAGLIYTDNKNGTLGILCEKFEASGFEMSNDELKSGQFKRDLSDVGHKVLRAMQDMAMSDRHVTATASGTSIAWSAVGSGTNPVTFSPGSGLVVGQQFAILNSSIHGATLVSIPNGHYILGTGGKILSLDGNTVDVVASNGTLDWEGAEDGNFGYDFFLDAGIYGQVHENGYNVTGDSTDYAPRPHLNYFKRGYRPFRPDATGLNIVSPTEEDAEETGQIKIMLKNADWTIGDDEIVSDVELQMTDTDEGTTDKSDLGHNLQLLRVKKIQCCNNVDAFTQRINRLNHGGRWNGEFHWNRHDSYTNKDITDSVEKYETLSGANDQAMFCKYGTTLINPGFEDTAYDWLISAAGNAADNWGAGTYPGTNSYGSVQDREVVRRVIENGMGGIPLVVNDATTVSSLTIPGGGHRISGYSGISQLPIAGRPLNKGPGDPPIVKQYETGTDPNFVTLASPVTAVYEFLFSPDTADVLAEHRYPHYGTGIVDCDLIKSIRNCELEGLEEATTITSVTNPSINSVKNDDGDMLVYGSQHFMQTGAVIKITAGTSKDDNYYWNNYKRVVVPLPPSWWKPLDGFSGSGTGNIEASSGINDSVTTILLATGHGARFPDANFLIIIGAETMRCVSRSTDTLTVVREELITTHSGGAPAAHSGGAVVALDTTSFNVAPSGAAVGISMSRSFYLTNLPHEAYEGISGTIPAAVLTKMPYEAGGITAYKRVYNVFNGACRVQYQSSKTRNELPNTDSYVLISDRARMDIPYMGVEVYAVADEDRQSATGELSGLTTGAATMPDTAGYAEASYGSGVPNTITGLKGGLGREIDGEQRFNMMPVRFRSGDKISETRFLTRDEETNHHDSSADCKHLFKNTQAIITENLMDDKKRAKTQTLTYGSGNDQNEVRRTVASLLTRTAKDLIRGKVTILEYPIVTLTGVAGSSTTAALLHPTQNVLTYGGRPGMMVTKTNGLDGPFMAGVLAEQITDDDIRGTLNTGSWAIGNHYRMYIHLRAGHSVRVTDPLSGVAANSIITKLNFRESPSMSTTTLEVIGYQDLPTATPVRPLGTVTKAVAENKGAVAGPITLGKARLNQLTFSSGDPS